MNFGFRISDFGLMLARLARAFGANGTRSILNPQIRNPKSKIRNRLVVALLVLITLTTTIAQDVQQPQQPVRFATVDLVIDTQDQPLAAYQLDFRATGGQVKIVSIEGGEHEAYRDAPYYDPIAIQQERVVLAGFNTAEGEKLPTGKTRIATIHVRIIGDAAPKFDVKLTVAATVDGKEIPATVTAITPRTPS